MNRVILSAVVGLVVCLSGCAAMQATNQKIAQDVQSIVEPIKQTTIDDAKAALATANARGDTDAAPCYQDIIDYLSQPSASLPQIAGVLSALEAARTFSAPQLPPKLHKDCAVLVVDAQQMALKLGLQLAPVAGGIKVQQGAAALQAEAAALKAAAGRP